MNYGFGGRLRAEFPSQVIIDITEVCNLACGHCPHPKFKESEHYAARYLDRWLNEKAVAEVAAWGSEYIRYCAEGEPLIHPECHEMIQHAVENSGTFVTLTTNGTILNKRRMRQLLDSGLHMIDVSIDAATAGTYEKVRGGDYEQVEANVLALSEMRGNCKLVVSFVEQPANAHEVLLFRSLWAQRADQVVIRRLHTAAGFAWQAIDQSGRYPCLYPWERIVLNPAGKLKFCPQEWFGGAEIADYRDTTIYDTWHSPAYDLLRQSHLSGHCKGVCERCPDWRQTRWPGQGESYADVVETVRQLAMGDA